MYVAIPVLQAHVLESNRIEGISIRSGNLVQSHLHTALDVVLRVREGMPVVANDIHRLLCLSTTMESFGGTYRACDVWVGDTVMPRWQEVPRLMDWWHELAVLCYKKQSEKSQAERTAMLLHDLFLCIHPYQDGNGRTARLLLNALRLRCGLPWLCIKSKEKRAYYRRIRSIERYVFKKEFPDVYP